MPTWAIPVVILACVGVGIGGYFLFIHLKAKREYAALTPHQRELHDAEAEYATKLKQAEKEHDATVKTLDREVKSAEKELQKAINGVNRPLGKYGQVRLFENRVETPEGTAYFEQGAVEAVVDTAGNIAVSQRVTLTRLVAGGIIGGLIFPKKRITDTRELYLMIKTPSFVSLTQCKPEHGSQVRHLATAINNMYVSSPQRKVERERAIASAQAALDAVKARHQEGSAAARARLEEARRATEQVDQARQRAVTTLTTLSQQGEHSRWQ